MVDTPRQYGAAGQGLVLDASGRKLMWADLGDAILNGIVLYTGAGATVYDNDDAGLAAAIAAASSGDTIWIPPHTFTGNYTIPAGVTLHGASQADVVFSGQITLSNGSAIENVSIVRSVDQAGAVYGIVEGSGGIEAALDNVVVNVSNATGPAYGVYMTNSGVIWAYNTKLYALTGNDGYAVYITYGDFYHNGGIALGTTALYPYWTA